MPLSKVASVSRIYVAGTRQGAGKTTFSLGFFPAAKDQIGSVGYIKPVSGRGIDPYTFRDYFGLPDSIRTMNPFKFEPSTTREYILAEDARREALKIERKEGIQAAFRAIAQDRQFVLIEGTGHSGVGYCVDLSNAIIAHLLQSPVIMMVEAGIGKTIDHSAQHLEYFYKKNVKVLGVVVNRVNARKKSAIAPALETAFKRLGVEVLGFLPFEQRLASATAREVGKQVGPLKSDETTYYGRPEDLQNLLRRCIIGAMPMRSIVEDLNRDEVTLVIPGYRGAFLAQVLKLIEQGKLKSVNAVIVVGRSAAVLHALERGHPFTVPLWHINADIPLDDIQAAVLQVISGSEHKIAGQDREKIEIAHRLVTQNVDVPKILSLAGYNGGE